MKKWKVTLLRSAEVEAETRAEAIHKAIPNYPHGVEADAVEARELQTQER